MARAELTRRGVADVPAPPSGKVRVYDTRIRGFFVEILPSGHKAFWLRYSAGRRRSREIKLGVYGDITVDQARTLAGRRRADISSGADPARERDLRRSALDFDQFIQGRFLPHIEGRLASFAEYSSIARLHLTPEFGRMLLTEITALDVERFRTKLIRSGISNGRVNRVLSLLRRCLNLAIQWGLHPGPNPAQAPGMLPESHREFFLDSQQMRGLLAAVALDRDSIAASIALMLLTGARRSEILQAKWECVDLQRRVLLVPRSKSGRRHFVVLSDAAVRLLAIQPRAPEAIYVFPSPRAANKPLATVRAAWLRVKVAAGLPPEFRLHDLRHTFASCLINGGASLYEVSKLLGHSQLRTTQRYAHLIPIALDIDRCPATGANGADAVGIGDEPVPRNLAGIDNVVVAVPHGCAELVLPQIIPDILHRVQVGTIRRQVQQDDIVRHYQCATNLVPASAITDQDGDGTGGHLRTDFRQMQVHHFGVCGGCNHGGADAAVRADRAKDIRGIMPIVAHHQRPGADRRPDIGVSTLLADTSFVLKPNLHRPREG